MKVSETLKKKLNCAETFKMSRVSVNFLASLSSISQQRTFFSLLYYIYFIYSEEIKAKKDELKKLSSKEQQNSKNLIILIDFGQFKQILGLSQKVLWKHSTKINILKAFETFTEKDILTSFTFLDKHFLKNWRKTKEAHQHIVFEEHSINPETIKNYGKNQQDKDKNKPLGFISVTFSNNFLLKFLFSPQNSILVSGQFNYQVSQFLNLNEGKSDYPCQYPKYNSYIYSLMIRLTSYDFYKIEPTPENPNPKQNPGKLASRTLQQLYPVALSTKSKNCKQTEAEIYNQWFSDLLSFGLITEFWITDNTYYYYLNTPNSKAKKEGVKKKLEQKIQAGNTQKSPTLEK